MKTQAELVIKTFGGIRPTARVVRRNPSTVSRWRIKGAVPPDVHKRILRASKKQNLGLRKRDLL